MISWLCSQQTQYQDQVVLVFLCELSEVRGYQRQVGAGWWGLVNLVGVEVTQQVVVVVVAGVSRDHLVLSILQYGQD